MSKTVLVNVSNTMPVKGNIGGYISGIGQSTRSLVDALNKIDNIPFNLELYATSFRARQCDFYDWKFKHRVIALPSKLKYKGRSFESYLRSKFLSYDLFHVTENYFDVADDEHFAVTIHDCTDLDTSMSTDVNDNLRPQLLERYLKMVKKSQLIATVSDFSKEEIVNYLNVNPDKIVPIYWGVDRHRFKVIDNNIIKKILDRFNINNPYFFACSCNRPRKNLINALRAYKKFLTYSPNHIFVIAWNNPFPEICQEFNKEITDRKIVFLPFLSDEELVALYNGASLSIYVSRKEGFGLPILESFACGTPVMTCSNSSLKEVGKDAAIYVGEDNVDEMVDVMRIFENGNFCYEEFLLKIESILNVFTWENTAKRYVDFYMRCLSNIY